MFGLIKKCFVNLLTSIVSASDHTRFALLNNQKCMTQPTLINLHPNEYRLKIILLFVCGKFR